MSAHYDLMPLSSGWAEPKKRRRLEDMGLLIPNDWKVSRNPKATEVRLAVQQLAEGGQLIVQEGFHIAGDDLDAVLAAAEDATFLSVEDYAKDGNENTPRHISFTYGDAELVLTVCERLAKICGPFLLTMDGAFFIIVSAGTPPDADWVSADFWLERKAMTTPQLKNRRAEVPDTLAPDGAEIRVLLDRPHGAERLSLAEALVKPGERTACVSHRTIEEFWYILKGTGVFHRLTPDGSLEETAVVAPGDALLIPTGYRFYVENIGQADLIFLCVGTPPWPGPDEAIVWDDRETE